MKFSVIMPSYLGNYAGAAIRRDEKLIRAVQSVVDQTFIDWELQVVADGCKTTVELMKQFTQPNIHCTLIPKAPMWDGKPRNTGIEKATGDYIIYLDIDDCYGDEHLRIISGQLADYDWVYYNDYIFRDEWIQRHCDIKKISMNGTSNICHKRSLGIRWGHRGYAHDYYFIQKLQMHRNYAKIDTPQYFVMHIPGGVDL